MVSTMPLPEPSPPPALEFRDVGYRYGSRVALSHVSFQVNAGGATLLLGPNGAGKTTLFSLACRLLATQSGEIAVLGASLARSGSDVLRPMGIVFQQTTLDLDLTVRQNLRYFASLHGLARSQADQRMATELERIGMGARVDEQVRSLNGGHRRRVEIARALLTEPRLLLLDEPTVGLDQPTRRTLVGYLHQLTRERGLAMLWATHLLDEVEPDDALVVIHSGRVQAAGACQDVIAQNGGGTLEGAFARLTAQAADAAA
jgi:ABC-2 type transport system ATP-binding protein